ncbi:uncharacterized protein [Montipora foliosa]|uniref:uncharacterized protein n=1 Tax=Montipora foliosa TaxID=591990 RepID=UPI0035F1D4F0
MGFAVVQWVGEDSISVINENQATEETIEEGDTVNVTSKTPKGKSVVYKALVLKVFATRSKANEYEASLIKTSQKEVHSPNNQDNKKKRKRKPSQKIVESANSPADHEDAEPVESQNKKVKEAKKTVKGASKKKADKENSENNSKLQHAVQEERIQAILNGRRTEGFTPTQPLICIGNNETPPPCATLTHNAHKQPTSPHAITKTPPPPQVLNVHPQQALPPQTETCTLLPSHIHQQKMAAMHTVSNTSSHTNNAHNLQTSPLHSGNRTPSPTHAYQQHQSVIPAATRTSEPI